MRLLLVHTRGDFPAGLEEADCHVTEKTMWQGTGGEPLGAKDLLSPEHKEMSSQQPVSLEEALQPQVGSQLWPSPRFQPDKTLHRRLSQPQVWREAQLTYATEPRSGKVRTPGAGGLGIRGAQGKGLRWTLPLHMQPSCGLPELVIQAPPLCHHRRVSLTR